MSPGRRQTMYVLVQLVSQVVRMPAKEWLRSHDLHRHYCVQFALKFLFRSRADSLRLLLKIDDPSRDIV